MKRIIIGIVLFGVLATYFALRDTLAVSRIFPGSLQGAASATHIRTFNGVHEYKLSNGLTVLLYPDDSSSKVTVNMTYLVGSRHEGYGETGMAHLLEHMLFKGSPKHEHLDVEISAHAADANATTWLDRTNYFETMQATEENIAWALSLESDRMVNAYIRQSDLDKEMTVVRNEMEGGENSPDMKLMEEVMNTAYLWHNYGNSTIGARSDVESVPAENLRAFYKKYYQPDNAVLVVAGGFKLEKTLAQVISQFGSIPKPSRILPSEYTVEPPQAGEKEVTIRGAKGTPQVLLGYHVPPAAHPDAPVIDAYLAILSDIPHGVLAHALVDSGLATSAGGSQLLLKDPGYALVGAAPRSVETLQKTEAELIRLLEGGAEAMLTESALKRIQAISKKGTSDVYTNLENFALYLSEWVALGDWRLFFSHNDAIQQVTLGDVRRVARTYFIASNRVTGRYIPGAQQQKVQIDRVSDEAREARAAAALGTSVAPGGMFDTSIDSLLKITQTKHIADGVFHFVPKDTRGDRVAGAFIFEFGSEQSLKGKKDIASLAGSVLMRGTDTLSEEEIQNEQIRLDATIQAAGSGNFLSVTIESRKDTFLDAFALAMDIVKHPNITHEQLLRDTRALRATLEAEEHNTDARAEDRLAEHSNTFPRDDIRSYASKEDQLRFLETVRKADVEAFWKTFYSANHVRGAIVGEYDQQAIEQALEQQLSTWKHKMPYKRLTARAPVATVITETIHIPEKSDATLAGSYDFKMRQDNPSFHALMLADFIFGGDGMNSRLMKRAREREGLTYGIGTSFFASPFDEFARWGLHATAAPENMKALEFAIRDEYKSIFAEGFSEAEVLQGRQALVKYLEQNRASHDAFAYELATLAIYELPLTTLKDDEVRIQALTKQAVDAAFRKYFLLDAMSFVKAGTF
ncbi:MAG: hypothetical protein RI911_868 [Candidatus Parcubacteria bacterium]|jgi:zinc protease